MGPDPIWLVFLKEEEIRTYREIPGVQRGEME